MNITSTGRNFGNIRQNLLQNCATLKNEFGSKKSSGLFPPRFTFKIKPNCILLKNSVLEKLKNPVDFMARCIYRYMHKIHWTLRLKKVPEKSPADVKKQKRGVARGLARVRARASEDN